MTAPPAAAAPARNTAQTKCRCGHSLAAHDTGPCIGITTADTERDRLRGALLCLCHAMEPT